MSSGEHEPIQRFADEAFTPRGFRVFADRKRPAEEVLYGFDCGVRVIESSIAFRGPHVRIYVGDDNVQLNFGEARMVAAALALFVEEAGAGLLTEQIEEDL